MAQKEKENINSNKMEVDKKRRRRANMLLEIEEKEEKTLLKPVVEITMANTVENLARNVIEPSWSHQEHTTPFKNTLDFSWAYQEAHQETRQEMKPFFKKPSNFTRLGQDFETPFKKPREQKE